MLFRGAIWGKTGKTAALPWICKIKSGSGGAPKYYGGLSLLGFACRAGGAPDFYECSQNVEFLLIKTLYFGRIPIKISWEYVAVQVQIFIPLLLTLSLTLLSAHILSSWNHFLWSIPNLIAPSNLKFKYAIMGIQWKFPKIQFTWDFGTEYFRKVQHMSIGFVPKKCKCIISQGFGFFHIFCISQVNCRWPKIFHICHIH